MHKRDRAKTATILKKKKYFRGEEHRHSTEISKRTLTWLLGPKTALREKSYRTQGQKERSCQFRRISGTQKEKGEINNANRLELISTKIIVMKQRATLKR